ncbi:hypothetical protein PIB30_070633 [Stylosanthes scabra]|uniref:Uncharacterized protein n=1 Tax=Stylosanthes scabra TaxID=79078 RepID=A0ABU6VPK7_9FABA|nr:hypothetical protein [Stylosanthes scabra]
MSNNIFLFILLVSSSVKAGFGDIGGDSPKSFALLRYWNKVVSNRLPKPSCLTSKASGLTPDQASKYAKLTATNSLTMCLPEFCSVAHLFCFPDTEQNISEGDTHQGRGFRNYDDSKQDPRFYNYGHPKQGAAFHSYDDSKQG